jgi:hypothetical protein
VVADPDDALMSLPELARACGMSASGLRNWANRPGQPLRGTPTPGGQVLYTWAHLCAFCDAHPELSGARKVAARLAGAPSPGPAMPEARRSQAEAPGQDGGAADPQQLRAILGDLRAAADYTVNAVLSAARSAEQTATAHREQVEALAAAIRSYDDLLTQLTAPATPHD